MNGLLSSVKVLDLSDEKGLLCSKLLAELGADVTMVEAPNGNSMRRMSPFYHNEPDLNKSLYWYAYNTDKRGVTLDITKAQGREILFQLVKKCDILIESFPPGYLDSIGCGYAKLSEIKPDIIVVSITPFGQKGPYRDFKASDLTLMAMGGHTYISGETGKAPLRTSMAQSFPLSGSHGAMAALIAYLHRTRTGEGQFIDISMHECCTWSSFFAFNFWDMNKKVISRLGGWRAFGPNRIKVLYECKDGYVSLWLLGGNFGARGQNKFKQWAMSEGLADDFWTNFDYDNWDAATSTQEICDKMAESVSKFIITKTKAELFDAAIEMGLYLAPVNSISDLLESEQLKYREYCVQVEHDDLSESLTYAGPFVKVLQGPPAKVKKRAPLLGEHNEEIYMGELGYSKTELLSLKSSGVI